MSDYISRKDLIDALNDNIRKSDMPFEWCQGMANAGYIIMHQPSADVVEVVRCKDCRYNKGINKCIHKDSIIKIPDDNDYCSYGKRREEDE